jgi:hypothetical protein
MSRASTEGDFKISDAPSSPIQPELETEHASNLPLHYGAPVLLAIARNPSTVFICWSVDWQSAFGNNFPADRKGHVRLKSGGSERNQAVEPLSGFCSISALQPGETYSVELGFYVPAGQWHVIASEEITMPFSPIAGEVETALTVATIPFHLSFQRLSELFGGHLGLAQSLAAFEEKMASNAARSEKDKQLLRALDFSSEDVEFVAAIRQGLEKVKPSPAAEYFRSVGGSSPGGSSWS